MKRVLGKSFAKGMAIVLCASMMSGIVGCGNTQEASSVQDASIAQASEELQVVADETAEKDNVQDFVRINDNGKPISDFDEFVNGEWKKQKEQENNGSSTIWWDEQYQVKEKVRDILDNTDISGMNEEDGLYKAISIYRHILDTTDSEQRIASAKKHLKPIEEIKSLEDIYQLYQSEEYMMFSTAFHFKMIPDYGGYHIACFKPDSQMSLITLLQGLNSGAETVPSADVSRQELLSMMEKLGYSEARTAEMLENAAKVGQMIDDYWNQQVNNTAAYFEQADLEKENVAVPVLEILEDLNFVGKYKQFMAKENVCELLNKLYCEENVDIIRDHFLLGTISKLMSIYGGDMIQAAYGTEYTEVAYIIATTYAQDVLNEEYNRRYLGDFNEQQALEIVEDIKNGYRDIISESEWLSVHGKELAKHKILTMRVSLGKNEIANDLSDVTLTGDIVDDFISLLISKERFDRSQIKKEDDKRQIFNANLFEVNARFIYEYNAIYVTGGLLENPYCSKDAAYEEMLGYFGATVAHEYGHSYDPKGINYDWHGWWENWMKEDEANTYFADQQKIADFFNGMEALYGRKIDGEVIKNETYADLMAMECCLKILEKRENPDYDLFFRTYARKNACYIMEQDADYIMSDEHLPGKQRVNYVLGQFDKFYEIYEIDETSPFYVPEEKRLSAF